MKEDFNITYKALFRKYYPNLIFYATRLVGEEEAEDVVQDVFVELWKPETRSRLSFTGLCIHVRSTC